MIEQSEEEGVTNARIALKIKGMYLNTNGHRKVKQLSPDLRCLVLRNENRFDGAKGATMSLAWKKNDNERIK